MINRNFSYEQDSPFLGFPASLMDAPFTDAATTAFKWRAQPQGWLLISAAGFLALLSPSSHLGVFAVDCGNK